MSSPLIDRPGRVGVFAPQYCASVRYYACLARYPQAVIDMGMRRDKRFKSAHRCDIADVRGRLSLTVPVEKVTAPTSWGNVRLSSHGQWWSDHVVSFESAYGRTPFFEYYFDRFRPFFVDPSSGPCATVGDLDRKLDILIRDILGLGTEVVYTLVDGIAAIDDFRGNAFPDVSDVEYYQVRADRLGFISGLSILDLIFNLGPEAPLLLRRMAK